MIERDHLLVVAIHEVHLDALQPKLLIKRQCLVHLVGKRAPVDPDEQPNAAPTTIIDERGQIDVGYAASDVRARIALTVRA